jgi:hypothetical protein
MTTWLVTLLRRLRIWALEDLSVRTQKSNAKDNASNKEKLIIKSHEKKINRNREGGWRCVTRGGFLSWLVVRCRHGWYSGGIRYARDRSSLSNQTTVIIFFLVCF